MLLYGPVGGITNTYRHGAVLQSTTSHGIPVFQTRYRLCKRLSKAQLPSNDV